MINWTEEDVEFLYKYLLPPFGDEMAKALDEYDKVNAEVLEKLSDALLKKISEIRYEQLRDRSFYKAMFTQFSRQNMLLSPDSYDEAYRVWCEEFDKLNKEKTND